MNETKSKDNPWAGLGPRWSRNKEVIEKDHPWGGLGPLGSYYEDSIESTDETIEKDFELLEREIQRIQQSVAFLTKGPPQKKTTIALQPVGELEKVIYFWADEDTAKDLTFFGDLRPYSSPAIYTSAECVRWYLAVDERYDYEEVVAYIASMQELFHV